MSNDFGSRPAFIPPMLGLEQPDRQIFKSPILASNMLPELQAGVVVDRLNRWFFSDMSSGSWTNDDQ